MKTYARVVFSKSTWLKGTIEKHTASAVKEAQADFIVKANRSAQSPFQVTSQCDSRSILQLSLSLGCKTSQLQDQQRCGRSRPAGLQGSSPARVWTTPHDCELQLPPVHRWPVSAVRSSPI